MENVSTRIDSTLYATATSRPNAVGASPIENAFINVPALQDNLDSATARRLATVSSTLNAVSDDEYVWRIILARELGISGNMLQYPVDRQARRTEDRTSTPYKTIFRGIHILDGEMAPVVASSNRDERQIDSVERAEQFLELHFPLRYESILERHSIYSSPSQAIRVHGVAMGVTAGLATTTSAGAVVSAKRAVHYATLSKAAAAKSALLTKFIAVIGLKATKALLCGFYGYVALEAIAITVGVGRISYREYQAMQAAWRETERKIVAVKINGHLAALRVEQEVNSHRRVNRDAGINETCLAMFTATEQDFAVIFGAAAP